VERCRYIIQEARAGNVQIWTSAFTLAEVFKKQCEGKGVALAESKDLEFEQYVEQEFFTVVQVDADLAIQARRLLRQHPKLKKPADAIHLATAVLYNLDELHTFDEDNLISLSGVVKRQDGSPLIVCKPPENPQPELFSVPQVAGEEQSAQATLAREPD
jgi:predicted nucleic acid-binding protein